MKAILMVFLFWGAVSDLAFASECKIELDGSASLSFQFTRIQLGEIADLIGPLYMRVRLRSTSMDRSPIFGTSSPVKASSSPVTIDVPIRSIKNAIASMPKDGNLEIVMELRGYEKWSRIGSMNRLLLWDSIPVKDLAGQIEGSPCFDGKSHPLMDPPTFLSAWRVIMVTTGPYLEE
jgi:hypothetical protein